VFRRGEPSYPLQVLALPSSGGLSTAIPHANGSTRTFVYNILTILSFRPKGEITLVIRQRLATLVTEFLV
jgi:hypothetical protein